MMLKGQFTVGLLHLVVAGIRTDAQHLIGILQRITLQMEHGIHLTLAQTHPKGALLQGRDLALGHAAIGLRHHHEVIQELKPLRVVHLLIDLSAALAHGLLELLPAFALLFVEELVQDLITLCHSVVAKVLAQHLAHHLHLGVHGLTVGLDDIRGEHEQGEEKTVPLSLLHPLAISPLIGLVIGLIGAL